MRKAVVGAIVALAFSSIAFGAGTAVATCSTTGAATLANGTPKVDSVASGQTDAFKVTVGSGQGGDVAVWGAGDVDLSVCKVGSSFTCGSDLIAGSPDACNIGGWDLDGKMLGPGTYRVEVTNCFDAACGYADGLPPVNYAIAFAAA